MDGKIEQSGQIGERQIVKAGERERGAEILLEIPCVCVHGGYAGRKGCGVYGRIIQAITCITY